MALKLSQTDFITSCSKIHKNKYDYSKVDYINARSDITIICPTHGAFTQRAKNHKDGYGCKTCGFEAMASKLSYGTDTFIKKAKKVHGDTFDYSKVVYKRQNIKIDIICKIHGSFKQTPEAHLFGQGCRKCANHKNSTLHFDTKESFISKSISLHGDKYDYSLVNYIDSKAKVKIICSTHGAFMQLPNGHLSNLGCRKCGHTISKGEIELYEWIKSIYPGTVIQNDRKVLNAKEIDIYIPSLNIGIEYNGTLWHSMKFKKDKYHIRDKSNLALSVGVRIIHIYEDLWLYNKDKIKALIKNALGLNEIKVGARSTSIKKISATQYKNFCEKYHTQNYRGAKYKYGMFYNNNLISVTGFSDKELIRFVVKPNHTIHGALSKFMKNHNKDVFSYCDLDMFSGAGYKAAGFVFKNNTVPQFWYVKCSGISNRLERRKFQKHLLKDVFKDVDMNLSEQLICANNNHYRLYGVGNALFEWHTN